MKAGWSRNALRLSVRNLAGVARRPQVRQARNFVCAIFVLALAACSVGPDYITPTAPDPVQFKEARGWKIATPRDDLAKGEWWKLFRDPLLDNLEQQVEISNQTLKQSEARYRSALAMIREAQAGQFPTIGATDQATRARSASLTAINPYTTTYTLEGTATWDLDVWGRIRRTVESDAAAAQASAADLANATDRDRYGRYRVGEGFARPLGAHRDQRHLRRCRH